MVGVPIAPVRGAAVLASEILNRTFETQDEAF
jgi:hypothetical protein